MKRPLHLDVAASIRPPAACLFAQIMPAAPEATIRTQLLGSVKDLCNCLMRDDATLILIAASLVGPAQRKAGQINYQNKATQQPTELAGVKT